MCLPLRTMVSRAAGCPMSFTTSALRGLAELERFGRRPDEAARGACRERRGAREQAGKPHAAAGCSAWRSASISRPSVRRKCASGGVGHDRVHL